MSRYSQDHNSDNGMIGSHVPRVSAQGGDRQGAHVVDMQRRRLLLAIAEAVAEDGLEGASIGRVCKRAGVSRRTFYELFEDREACFLAAFDQAIERILERVLPVYGREGRWQARMRDALIALLKCFEEEPHLARLCVIETLKAGPEVLDSRRRVLNALIAVVEEGRLEAKRNMTAPPLTAESTVGGALAVIHARLVEGSSRPLVELASPLTSMIVYPYLGPAAARKELERPTPGASSNGCAPKLGLDPFHDLSIRITFRTARVLATISERPGTSNRKVGDAAGVADPGQMSKLLRRLEGSGLIENLSEGQPKGEPNAWRLTTRGEAVQAVLGAQNVA